MEVLVTLDLVLKSAIQMIKDIFTTVCHITSLIIILIIPGKLLGFQKTGIQINQEVTSYIVDPQIMDLKLYWKNVDGMIYGTFEALKNDLASKNQKLIFVMNGGIFKPDHSPLGLYIENGKTLNALNNNNAPSGNYYLGTKGIFYITKQKTGKISIATEPIIIRDIAYATQSGPLLVIDGKIENKFEKGSNNRNIRNGVGILPNGRIMFAISNNEINFYDFAKYFKDAGCQYALYMDGIISRFYHYQKKLVNNSVQFAVMIAVTEIKKH